MFRLLHIRQALRSLHWDRIHMGSFQLTLRQLFLNLVKPLEPTSKSLNFSQSWESGTNLLRWHLGGWNPPGSDNFTSFKVWCGFPIPQMNTWWNCTLSSLTTAYLHLNRLQHRFCCWQSSEALWTRRRTVCAVMPELIRHLLFCSCISLCSVHVFSIVMHCRFYCPFLHIWLNVLSLILSKDGTELILHFQSSSKLRVHLRTAFVWRLRNAVKL